MSGSTSDSRSGGGSVSTACAAASGRVYAVRLCALRAAISAELVAWTCASHSSAATERTSRDSACRSPDSDGRSGVDGSDVAVSLAIGPLTVSCGVGSSGGIGAGAGAGAGIGGAGVHSTPTVVQSLKVLPSVTRRLTVGAWSVAVATKRIWPDCSALRLNCPSAVPGAFTASKRPPVTVPTSTRRDVVLPSGSCAFSTAGPSVSGWSLWIFQGASVSAGGSLTLSMKTVRVCGALLRTPSRTVAVRTTEARCSWSSVAGSTTRMVPVAASTASAGLPASVQPDRVVPGSASVARSVPTTVPAGLFSRTCRVCAASTTGALGTTCTGTALPNSELSPQGRAAVAADCTVAVADTT